MATDVFNSLGFQPQGSGEADPFALLGFQPTESTKPANRYDVQETQVAKVNRYKAEAQAAKEKADTANSVVEKYVRPVADSVLPGVASLGDTIAGILNTNSLDKNHQKTTQMLSDSQFKLQKQIQEGDKLGQDTTRLKQLFNENADSLDRINAQYNEATAGAQKSTGQVAGELGLTALNLLTAGTYGKATAGMRAGELALPKVLGGVSKTIPTAVENARSILPTGVFSKQGAKNIATGVAKALPLGYGYDVASGLAGQRGEDRTGGAAFIPGAATAISGVLGGAVPTLSEGGQTVKNLTDREKKVANIISNREQEIYNIENNYAQTRKNMSFSKDANSESRKRIASTDILSNAVDENGLIRTKEKGGAVDQYKAMTLDGAEQVVRNDLEREGATVSPDVVKANLERNIKTSGLEGKALTTALNNVNDEVAGLMVRATPDGRIPLTAIHDAKISTTNGINYMTEPFVKSERKAVANAYKTIVENHSSLNVKDVNQELGKYLKDIQLLESLDGKRVKGGKLGKYFAQISGNIVGGAIGSAVGGPLGGAAGTVVGGELGSRIKGSFLQRTLGGETGKVAPKSVVLENAIERSKSPRLMLNAPVEGAPRSSVGSGPTISLPPKSQSAIDLQEKSLGSRNAQYSTPNTTITKDNIAKNIEQSRQNSKQVIEDTLNGLREEYRLSNKTQLENAKAYGVVPEKATAGSLTKVYRASGEPIKIGDHVSLTENGAMKYVTPSNGKSVQNRTVQLQDLVKARGTGNEFIYAPKKVEPKNLQGGFIKGADGNKVPRIHTDDKRVMKDFTDYVAGEMGHLSQREEYNLELEASRIAERYNIKSFKTNQGLAHEFGRILDDQGLDFGKIAANPLVAGALIAGGAAVGASQLKKKK